MSKLGALMRVLGMVMDADCGPHNIPCILVWHGVASRPGPSNDILTTDSPTNLIVAR